MNTSSLIKPKLQLVDVGVGRVRSAGVSDAMGCRLDPTVLSPDAVAVANLYSDLELGGAYNPSDRTYNVYIHVYARSRKVDAYGSGSLACDDVATAEVGSSEYHANQGRV